MKSLLLKVCIAALTAAILTFIVTKPSIIKQSQMGSRLESPIVIFVNNRVPKCGSSLFMEVLTKLSKSMANFTLIRSRDYSHYRIAAQDQQKLKEVIVSDAQNSSSRTLLYDRHFHFVKFESKPSIIFHYINQLRDPLQRALSQYYYERYICDVIHVYQACYMLHPSYHNLTLDTCVATGDPARCVTKPYGIHSSIAFFCGQESICDDTVSPPTSEAALSLAKRNIERYYIHVGLVEYIEGSLELLEHIQPLFTGIVRLYGQSFNRTRVYNTPAKYRHAASNKTRAIIRSLLQAEYELYYFVRQRFIDHYTRVFQRTPLYHPPGH
ncbi:unnamed protein product [Rotaria sp. Silwood2]|nr:unnamed protein product [Rotaria sp. Silwood2]